MATYSPELKEQVIKKMMPPRSQSVAQISRETGISAPTLYAWKKQFQNRGFVVPTRGSTPDRWDTRAKLAAVIQTAPTNEAERSTYCREHGLYPEQLDAWKEAFEAMDTGGFPADKAQLAAERKKSRKLAKELLRKERAMDETPIKAGHQKGAGLQKGKMKSGWFWPMYGDADEVVFTYSNSRGKLHIEQVLQDQFCGTLISDGYAAYARYAAAQETITHAQCWVHYLECCFMWSRRLLGRSFSLWRGTSLTRHNTYSCAEMS